MSASWFPELGGPAAATHHLRPLDPEDADDIAALFDADHGYFEAIQGAPPGQGEVQSLFLGLPEGHGDEDKHLFALVRSADEHLDGIVDLIADHPEPGTWTLGAVFVHPDARRHGLARATIESLARWLTERGAGSLRGATADVPGAVELLQATGFVEQPPAPNPQRPDRPTRTFLRALG